MEKDLEIVVQFDSPIEGFRTEVPYAAITLREKELLLIDEDGRFRWIPVEACCPHRVLRKNEEVFDRSWYEVRKRNEALLGKRVVVKSLEEMGIPGEQRDESGYYCFQGTLDSFERDLLTVVGVGEPPMVAKITHKQVFSIEEA